MEKELQRRIKLSETHKRLGTKPPSRLGMKMSEEFKAKRKEAWMGEYNPTRGKKHSEETRLKMSLAKKGKPGNKLGKKGQIPWNKGKKLPQCSGENHRLWKSDRTEIMEKHRLRGTLEWKKWRTSIFARDLFTCKECGVYGGFLEPHHIIPIRSDKSKLFDLKNGITLCRPCHQKTIWKESNFAEKYSAIVAAHL